MASFGLPNQDPNAGAAVRPVRPSRPVPPQIPNNSLFPDDVTLPDDFGANVISIDDFIPSGPVIPPTFNAPPVRIEQQPEPSFTAPATRPEPITPRSTEVSPTPARRADGPVSAPGAGTVGIRIETRQAETPLDLDSLLRYLTEQGGSDLHLSVGAPPTIRANGEMRHVPGVAPMSSQVIKDALYGIASPDQIAKFEKDFELDLAHTVEGVSRFRVNMMIQKGNVGAVFRGIPSVIKPLEELGMPPVLYTFANLPRGLVLVCGPTGSGKSTTLAALIDRANRTRSGHIITIEDPIEFLHTHRKSVVNQREVGADTHSFSEALKHVLRQDPDIILIGELRDLETISIALTAAETGHLVFATLHTQSAQDSVSRIIDVFPGGQQQQIRSQLAATLKGVVCQTLVKKADNSGRAVAAEIMVVTPAIANMIRQDQVHQIPGTLQSGGDKGMQTLNASLATLVATGVIERETAEEIATDSKDLEALIAGEMKKINRPSFSSSSNGSLGSM